MPHHHTNNRSDRSKYRYERDKESTGKENSKVNGHSSSSRKQKNRLKKAVKRFKDGFDFTDPEEALQFVMENRLENLFVKEDVGTHAFLVRVSFELAAAGKKVLFLYDEHRQRNRMKKTFEHAFDVQANGDPVKKAMVCADLEELSDSMKKVRRAIEGKKILTGSMDCPEFSGVAKRLNNRNIFVPDTIIISGLEWMTPELFLKFLETWKVRIVASYSMNGGFSAADFVRGNEERLNILMQEPSDSSVEEPSAQMTID